MGSNPILAASDQWKRCECVAAAARTVDSYTPWFLPFFYPRTPAGPDPARTRPDPLPAHR